MKKVKKENNIDVLVLEKNSKVGYILIILIMLLLIGGGVYYYFNYLTNPSYIMGKALKKVSLKELETVNGPFRVRGSAKFGFEDANSEYQDTYDILNNLDLLYNLEMDLEEKVSKIGLSSQYKNKDFLNLKAYQEGEEVYLLLENIYDKYLKVDYAKEEKSDEVPSISKEDIKVIAEGVLEVIKDAFLESDYRREKVSIDYSKKRIEVYKNYLSYNEDNYMIINKRISESIKENKELLDTLNRVIGKEKIDKFLLELIKEQDMEGLNLEFVIYTQGITNKFIKMMINMWDNDGKLIMEIDNKKTFSFSFEMDEIVLKLTITENEMNNCLINLNFSEDGVGSINAEVSMIYEKLKVVDKINKDKVVDVKELTEEDLLAIFEKVNENETLSQIVNDYSGVLIG